MNFSKEIITYQYLWWEVGRLYWVKQSFYLFGCRYFLILVKLKKVLRNHIGIWNGEQLIFSELNLRMEELEELVQFLQLDQRTDLKVKCCFVPREQNIFKETFKINGDLSRLWKNKFQSSYSRCSSNLTDQPILNKKNTL